MKKYYIGYSEENYEIIISDNKFDPDLTKILAVKKNRKDAINVCIELSNKFHEWRRKNGKWHVFHNGDTFFIEDDDYYSDYDKCSLIHHVKECNNKKEAEEYMYKCLEEDENVANVYYSYDSSHPGYFIEDNNYKPQGPVQFVEQFDNYDDARNYCIEYDINYFIDNLSPDQIIYGKPFKINNNDSKINLDKIFNMTSLYTELDIYYKCSYYEYARWITKHEIAKCIINKHGNKFYPRLELYMIHQDIIDCY